MKRIIVLLIRIIIFYLLGIFIYQKTTWKTANGIIARETIDRIASVVQDKVRSFGSSFQAPRSSTWVHNQSGETSPVIEDDQSGSLQNWSNIDETRSTQESAKLARVKTGLQRNQDFASNLLNNSFDPQKSIGKGDMYVIRSGSQDHTQDQIIITLWWETISYPAKYNIDNALALPQWWSNDPVYRANGVIALDADTYYVYYWARNSQWNLKGYIMNANNGNTIVKDNLLPLLFYKNQYYFSIRSNGYKWLYKIQNGTLTSLTDNAINGISIENDFIAIHDIDQNVIQLFSITDTIPSAILPLHRPSIEFQAFLMQTGSTWIKYKDNLKQATVYENYLTK